MATENVSRETRAAAPGELGARDEDLSLRARAVSASLAELAAADISPLHVVALNGGFQWFSNRRIADVFAGIVGAPVVEVER
jgi:hypothetical protein